MIGWHIELGYISGYSGEMDWSAVCEVAQTLTLDTETLGTEASLYAPTFHDQIVDVAATYHPDTKFGRPFGFDEQQIMITASGGGEYRTAKEHVARAFVRLLLAEAHKRGIDLNVTVA